MAQAGAHRQRLELKGQPAGQANKKGQREDAAPQWP
jgi:hypothetical protein